MRSLPATKRASICFIFVIVIPNLPKKLNYSKPKIKS